jgi:hypothetical protein
MNLSDVPQVNPDGLTSHSSFTPLALGYIPMAAKTAVATTFNQVQKGTGCR